MLGADKLGANGHESTMLMPIGSPLSPAKKARQRSGSRLAKTLNNLSIVPRMKNYNTIAYQEGHEWDTAFEEFLNEVSNLVGDRLTDQRIRSKRAEFNRMNNVLKIFMIDTTSKKLASVSTRDVLTALFSRYNFLITIWANRRNADRVADAASGAIQVCLSTMAQADGGNAGGGGGFVEFMSERVARLGSFEDEFGRRARHEGMMMLFL